MKKIFFLLFQIIIFSTYGQNILLLDATTDKPLENVVITSLYPNKTVTTNQYGKANITPFLHAKKIEIRLVGYKTIITDYKRIKEKNFILKLKPFYFNLDEVVISATRWRQAQNRIPARIIHIKKRDIKLFNPQTVADMLGSSGKVYIQKSQLAGGSPIIRGFSTNRLLYTVDGVRMNTAIFRSGNLQNVISLDAFAIQNSEVLFGANSVIYGSDAIGGVMSFQTLKPQFSLTDKPLIKGSFSIRYSDANQEKTGHFDVNSGWKKWALIISLSTSNYNHLRQGSFGNKTYLRKNTIQTGLNGNDIVLLNPDTRIQSPSGYSQSNLMQKIAYRPNQNWIFSSATHYSETSPYGRYDRHLRMNKGLPKYAEWNYGKQKWFMNLFKLTHSKSNFFYDQLTTRLAFQQFEESRIVRKFKKINRETNKEKVNAYSINFDFKKMITNKHTLYYGFEWVKNSVKSKGIGKNITNDSTWSISARYPQSHWESFATYTNIQCRLSNKWTLQSGLRYNIYQLNGKFDKPTMNEYQFPFNKIENKNSALTGSLGWVYRSHNNLIISNNLSTGFRSPNVDDMGKVFDPAKGFVVVPNPNLEPEYATNIDLSFVKVFSNILRLDITAYYTYLNHVLSIDNFQLNGQDSIFYKGDKSKIEALQNKLKANVYGLQFSAEWKLLSYLTISSDINYQKGVEIDKNNKKAPLRHTIPLFGNVQLNYHNSKLTMQLYANYQAEMKNKDIPQSEQKKVEIYALDKNKKVYSPAWCTLNFKANYRLSKNILLGAGVENITDLRYRPYLSGISAAGRNIIMSLNITF